MPHVASLGLILWVVGTPPAGGEDRLEVEPAAVVLAGTRSAQQLVVSRPGADVAMVDVTREARYRVEPPMLASVTSTGLVLPRLDGPGRIIVEVGPSRRELPIEVRQFVAIPPVSYRHEVAAVLTRAGCSMGACHGNLSGKGGFKLSLRGEDPGADFDVLTRAAMGRRIDVLDPGASLLLLKPLGRSPHEGGVRFAADSESARLLRGWIAEGARDDRRVASTLVDLTVYPRERTLEARSGGQQLLVQARFADGTTRDVTRLASFDVNDPTRSRVESDGRVVVGGPCEVAVAVRYLDRRAVSRLAFRADRPDFAWSGPASARPIDVHAQARLQALRVNASALADDPTFLRRAYLDAIGTLPTPEEVRRFLDGDDPDRRAHLVDELLARPEFATFWALKWADLLRNEEKTMGAKGVWIFQRWLRDAIASDVPLDQLARSLVSARGSTWKNPPASFHRTNRDPEAEAEAVAQVFLGVRMQCARCHNHPFDVWTQDDYYGLAAYFANIGRKAPNNQRRDKFDKHEINSDEVIYLQGRPERLQPRSRAMMQPRPPGTAVSGLPPGDPDALDDLADWLTRDNRQFARNLANRVWFHLVGRGIVDPVDDFRESNPPSNPALLEVLADDLVRDGYGLRPLVRRIMTSATYQLSSRPDTTNAEDETGTARAVVKLLPAEVLWDAVGQALDHRPAFDRASGPARAIELPGVRSGAEFLRVFGKPDRLLTCECERSDSTTLAQAFQLINGERLREALEAPGNRIGRLLESGATDDAVLEELYLATLSRRPASEEQSAARAHLEAAGDRRKAWEDLAWALVNSKEFLLRH